MGILANRPILHRAAELAIDAAQEAIQRRRQGATTMTPTERATAVERATEQLASDPVLVNETNNEPWYESRVIVGAITTIIGIVLRFVGVNTDEDTMTAVGDGVTAFGTLWALIGRLLKNRGPMNWNPLSWFGLVKS